MSRTGIKDPMLFAASEGIASPDHLRWLSYADAELARLRERLGLPTPKGYNNGEPNYSTEASAEAVRLVFDIERRANGQFRPDDRRAVAEVIDEILTEARAA
jgi:hypothetical protein